MVPCRELYGTLTYLTQVQGSYSSNHDKKFLKLTNTKELGINRKTQNCPKFLRSNYHIEVTELFHCDIYLKETTMNNSESRFLSIEKKRKRKL